MSSVETSVDSDCVWAADALFIIGLMLRMEMASSAINSKGVILLDSFIIFPLELSEHVGLEPIDFKDF